MKCITNISFSREVKNLVMVMAISKFHIKKFLNPISVAYIILKLRRSALSARHSWKVIGITIPRANNIFKILAPFQHFEVSLTNTLKYRFTFLCDHNSRQIH